MAGAGIKPGTVGTTDELGLRAQETPYHVRDIHATVLHLLGIDHERLTYYHGGLERRLTNVSGRVIEELLAS